MALFETLVEARPIHQDYMELYKMEEADGAVWYHLRYSNPSKVRYQVPFRSREEASKELDRLEKLYPPTN